MIDQFVEVSSGGYYLHVKRGFLLLENKEDDEADAKIALDDIHALIISTKWCSFSNKVMIALPERGAPVVFCDRKYQPISFLMPVNGNYRQAAVMDAQFRAGLPMRKRLWKEIVVSKIEFQAEVLKICNRASLALECLSKNVRSGDPENVEAQAAAYYFKELFGSDFRRDREEAGINTALNYGYMVLRATVARAVVGAGLHPTPSLHHKHSLNCMRLVDDLVEPFRPFVDLVVFRTPEASNEDLQPRMKARMISMLHSKLHGSDGKTTMIRHIRLLAQSLVNILMEERKRLQLPEKSALIHFESESGLFD
ncbi:MAG: type II CRISPR-associated endonuclease Cas1 [Opitutales bacterium]|nr:type II CRISPR-associated endonuclease Cas1 [Opitutales bacterium]